MEKHSRIERQIVNTHELPWKNGLNQSVISDKVYLRFLSDQKHSVRRHQSTYYFRQSRSTHQLLENTL